MNNRAERRRQERKAKETQKTLTSGDGTFWDLKSAVIHLKSEEEVAKALGVSPWLLRRLDPFNRGNGEFSKHRVVGSCQRLLRGLNPFNKVKTLYNVKTVNNL